MAPGRNDPCPCGSRRKYKHCCGRGSPQEPLRGPVLSLPPEVKEFARRSPEWEADMLALPGIIDGERDARNVALLVTAHDLVLQCDMRSVTATEPEDVARALEEAVLAAGTAVGCLPEAVMVRRDEVADALLPLLESRGCEVESDPFLRGLDQVAQEIFSRLMEEDVWPAVPPPETWAAWGLPTSMVAELFRAFARFYRAAPWRWLDVIPPVVAEWEGEAEPWLVSVLGSGMEEYGLAVYSEPEDFEAMLDLDGEEDPYKDLGGWVVHMGFAHRRALTRPMVKEIARNGWEVVGEEAYPFVLPILTPGGGLQKSLVRRLIRLLDGIGALAETDGEARPTPEGDGFIRREGDLTLSYEPPPWADMDLEDLPPGFEEILEELRLGNLESPEDVEAHVARLMEAYNTAPQAELGAISPDQARVLLQEGLEGTGVLGLAEDLPVEELESSNFLANARAFLARVVEMGGAPATAAGNLKRSFVAEMLEVLRLEEGYADQLHRMNKVINEADVWPLHGLRVNLELAGLLRKRKGKFVPTRKGRALAEPAAAGQLFAHLFRTHFGEFNLSYGSRGTEPEALPQEVLPLLLWQLGAWAGDWLTVGDLAEKVFFRGPESPAASEAGRLPHGAGRSLHRILVPLRDFGLLEARSRKGSEGWRWRPEAMEIRTTPLFRRFFLFRWES